MGRTFAGLRRRIMVVSADATAKRGIDTIKPAACRRCDGQAHKYAEAIPNWRVMGAESVQRPPFRGRKLGAGASRPQNRTRAKGHLSRIGSGFRAGAPTCVIITTSCLGLF